MVELENLENIYRENNKEEEIQTFNTIVYKDDILQSYLKDIGKIKLLKTEEELELGRLTAAGDLKAKQKLIQANLRLVLSA